MRTMTGRVAGRVWAVLLCAAAAATVAGAAAGAGAGLIRPAGAAGCAEDARPAALAIDGDPSTAWVSPPANSERNHRRFIDILLDGSYDLSRVEVVNLPGGYCHYRVYASRDGRDFSKIAFKNDDAPAAAGGRAHDVSAAPGAKGVSRVRVSVGFRSGRDAADLAEVRLYGSRRGPAAPGPGPADVPDFAATEWGREFRRTAEDPAYAARKTLRELSGLAGRVAGKEWAGRFVFRLENAGKDPGKDAFSVEARGGKVVIRGRNGVSLAAGFNFYLKNYARVNYNPLFAGAVKMPAALPDTPGRVVRESPYGIRYALNFCTFSYTMAFWGWEEYGPFLDWCAMNGVNTLLDIVGQEEVQRRLLRKYGYTDGEIADYLCGPAYFAWFYMQNLTSIGGPLPDAWFGRRVELARRMHDRMLALGIRPVLQGFAGMVPLDFGKKRPDAEVIRQGGWCAFARPHMLKTCGIPPGKRDYFSEMADSFYRIQKDVFGDVTDFYAVDPFHEGGITAGLPLPDVYNRVQRKMLDNDPSAVWVMMQWQGQINDAKLGRLADPSRALVLDLNAALDPRNAVMERRGVPWVWCMLHNFGGRMGVDGDVETLCREIPRCLASKRHMAGIGITPEAFGNSPLVYDLLFDMAWTRRPADPAAYVENYVKSRYGTETPSPALLDAWRILARTAYGKKPAYKQGAPETVINAVPGDRFRAASTWGHSLFQYDVRAFEQAVPAFIAAYDRHRASPAFLYDMTDVVKQMLATSAIQYHRLMIRARQDRDPARFRAASRQFLNLIALQERVLACRPEFSAAKWLRAARRVFPGMDDWTKDLFEANARSLVTTWSAERPGGLNDYSNRQWSGLTGRYYLARWADFVNASSAALETGAAPRFADYYLMGREWAARTSDEPGDALPDTPSGADLKALAQTAFNRFSLARLGAFESSLRETCLSRGLPVSAAPGNAAAPSPSPALALLTDGDDAGTWACPAPGPVSLTIDLPAPRRLSRIDFTLPQVAAGFPWDFSLQVFAAGVWVDVPSRRQDVLQGVVSTPCALTASRVRYAFSPRPGASSPNVELAELSVYGLPETGN